MTWLKQNWFRFFIIIAVFIYLLLIIYEQRRETRVFNADLIKWCATHSYDSCDDFVKKARLGAPWEFWDWVR